MINIQLILFYLLISLFGISLFIQYFYFLFFYLRLPRYRPKTEKTELKPVSVIITARNEAANLEQNLSYIFEQDYPEFEVIVVNDASEDETSDILKRLSQTHKNLVIRTIPDKSKIFFKGKKLALTIGIKAARYNYILLTDADCRPINKHWIRSMQNGFSDNKEIVLGYSGYYRKSGFVNKLIQYDTFYTALQYFSYALAGMPYMGVGRNLCYTKTLFTQSSGFKNHYYIHSGDDDLFVNENATQNNVAIIPEEEGHTISEPKKSFSEWMMQKRRHFISSNHYKNTHKFLLALDPISRVLVLFSFGLLFFFSNKWIIIIAGSLLIFKFILQLIIFSKSQKRIGIEKFLVPSFFIDLIVPFIYFTIHFINKVAPKTIQWK